MGYEAMISTVNRQSEAIDCASGQKLKSFFSKLMAGFCALYEVFIPTLPIRIVVNSFANFYKNRICRSVVDLRKEKTRDTGKRKTEILIY